MASPAAELSLEWKPHSYSLLLKSFGDQLQTDQTQKLEEFLACLEQERLKIEAFKRELPLCMQLLTNAMETSRQQLNSHRANQGRKKTVVEEFIPLKKSTSEGSEKALINISDKANWMISAQLWSQATGESKQNSPVLISLKETETETETGFGAKQKNRGSGAFIPFTKDRSQSNLQGLNGFAELALASSDNKEMEQEKVGSGHADTQSNTKNAPADSQNNRKARRCWSPDLHRRFVNALQMLGGSQVATPKQIRELMKVDGLTNDEVKSHLQKYRLHTRRPSTSPQAAAAAATGAPQLVVLGGIWVPQEYATAVSAAHGGATAALYGPHPTTHASPHYCATPLPQEFYTAPTPPPLHHQLHHHHQFHNQIHVYQTPSQVQGSPESDVRGDTSDRSESIEDGKSESSSWKADSNGENGGGGRKSLVVREEGEESNGSEITLKF